jgi:hypothetical protein
MAEFTFMKNVLAAFGRGSVRLFRSNAGVSWQGDEVQRTAKVVVLENPRAIHGWPAGTADLVGWQTVTVTPEMVGRRVALFVAVETKSPRGRLTAAQRRFLAAVESAGGRACVARTLDDVAAALGPPGAPGPSAATRAGEPRGRPAVIGERPTRGV